MKCPECAEELAVEECDTRHEEQGFYWICPVCNYSSLCMTESEFAESDVYRPGTEGEERTTGYPTNERLKTDIERFVVHQALEAVHELKGAYAELWMGQRKEAKETLIRVRVQIKDIINLIPDEEKEETGNRLREQGRTHN